MKIINNTLLNLNRKLERLKVQNNKNKDKLQKQEIQLKDLKQKI